MLKRFLAYYKPHKKLLALDLLASMLISVIGMVYPIVTNKMLNDLIPNKLYKQIILAGIIVLVLYVIRIISFFQVCGGKAVEPAILRSIGFLK